MKRIILLLSSVLLFACNDVKIVDGKIPAKYLAQAQKFVGVYHGKFDHQTGDLVVSLAGDVMKVQFKGADGKDILDPSCQSKIGVLKSISTREIDGKVEIRRAAFDFNPNLCSAWIVGNTLDFSVDVSDGKAQLYVSLLADYSTNENCHYEPINPPGNARRVCDPPRADYLYGQFSRALP